MSISKIISVALVCVTSLSFAPARSSEKVVRPCEDFRQDEENWPSLPYLKSDYKSVSVVAHVLIREAEITGRVGGYENWKVSCEVLESFKGRFRRHDVVEYFQGAEAGLKKEYFSGEKIVFLLANYDKKKKAVRYSVLENSTLPHTEDRVRKLRIIRRSLTKSHSK